MRALVTRLLPDKRREKILVQDWPEPNAPIGNQFKTRTVYSGVTNGTERNDLMSGNYARPDHALPALWGYQNVGRVIEIGPDVKNLQVGDLLYMSADHQEYVVMAEDGLFIKIPEDVDPVKAALFGMSSVAMHSCRNADLRMGETVLIVGSGFIGQIASQIALTMGARPTLCDLDAKRLDRAHQANALIETVVIEPDKWSETFEGRRFDVVLDFAGAPNFEDKLLEVIQDKGRLLFVAGRTRVNYNFNLGQWREVTIKQNTHFTNSDLENLCRLVRAGLVKIDPLIQDVVPVTEADRIYIALRDTPNELNGTVFVWGA